MWSATGVKVYADLLQSKASYYSIINEFSRNVLLLANTLHNGFVQFATAYMVIMVLYSTYI